MAEEKVQRPQATQEEYWSHFEGLKSYREWEKNVTVHEDDSPIPEEVIKPAVPQQQQQQQKQEGEKTDEDKEALGILRAHAQQKRQMELQQKNQMLQQEEQYTQQFVSNMEQALAQSPELLGVQLTNREKRDLFNYMFNFDKTGVSPFIKEYNSNPMNILNAAFLCRYGKDAILKMQGVSRKMAMNQFQEALRQQNVKTRGATRQAAASYSKSKKNPLSAFVNAFGNK